MAAVRRLRRRLLATTNHQEPGDDPILPIDSAAPAEGAMRGGVRLGREGGDPMYQDRPAPYPAPASQPRISSTVPWCMELTGEKAAGQEGGVNI